MQYFLWGPIKGKVIHNIQGHNSHRHDTPRYNQLKIIGILYIQNDYKYTFFQFQSKGP